MLVASRRSQVFPVAMSMLASFLSAVTIIGIPAEIYYNGSMFIFACVGYTLCYITGAEVFAPIYHKMEVTSAQEVSTDASLTEFLFCQSLTE